MEHYNNVNGDINTTNDVIVYGNVNGDIKCQGRCIVYGRVAGDIKANTFERKEDKDPEITNKVENKQVSIDSIMKKVSSSVGNICSSIGNDLYMSGGGGKQTVTHNGNKITSRDGVITINGKEYEGSSLQIKENEVYIDGVKVEEVKLR